MANPLFSLITVTLNPGEGLGRTIESVKAQRCRDFEHLVKDAGSSDGSVERYARAAQDYCPIIIHKPDGGIYDAMNQALDYANGKYVLFLNAGDLLYDGEVLERVAGVVRQNPALGLVYGDYFAAPLQVVVKSPRRLSSFFIYRTMLCHQAWFAAHEEIDKLGRFDTALRVVADYDLLLRLVLDAGVSSQYVEKTIASYLDGGFSTQPHNRQSALEERKLLLRRHFRPLDRLLYGCLWAATLPQLRIRLMRSKHLAPVQRQYIRMVNLWNT